jgi:hypothetical protein
MNRCALTCILALAVGAGCSTLSVHTAHSPDADFSRYRTFAWMPNNGSSGLQPGGLAEQRIQANVANSLAQKGIQPATTTPPDFYVAYHAATKEKMTATNWGYDPIGVGWGSPDVTVTTYTQGTLVIDFIDASTHKVFWSGRATDVVNETGSNAEKVDKAIGKMMAQFPPPAAG